MGSTNTESLRLINQHNNRIIDLYRASLKYFKDDVSLWKEYIKFLMKCVSKDRFCNSNYFNLHYLYLNDMPISKCITIIQYFYQMEHNN